MMFNPVDRRSLLDLRDALNRLEGKMDGVVVRISLVEQKQATHEAVCDQREMNLRDYIIRRDKEEIEAKEEWKEFKESSSRDRQAIRDKIETSNNALLFKVIGALIGIIGIAASILITLLEKGIILK